ncbi:hypothetical protein E4U46_002627 [Claviceps purpurea]|nr:hypothetical protein E4U46_002627 [Claviceps purpurea]
MSSKTEADQASRAREAIPVSLKISRLSAMTTRLCSQHLAIKFAAAARPAAPIPSTQSQLGSEFKSYGLDAGGS